MSEFVISTRYANALMSVSEEKGSFENVFKNISFVMNTVQGSKELRNFLSSPVVSSANKSVVLKEIFQSHVRDDVTNFLQFLVDKGRENLLMDICKRFIALSNEKLNQVDVAITSAVELTESQKVEIQLKLESMINKNVTASFVINKNIIGGFKARFNDTVIDASIQHQLELLKKKLFEEDFLKN